PAPRGSSRRRREPPDRRGRGPACPSHRAEVPPAAPPTRTLARRAFAPNRCALLHRSRACRAELPRISAACGSQCPASVTAHRSLGQGERVMQVTFFGVRGSIATAGPEVAKFGGNTTCLEVVYDGHRLVLDGGTGLRALGDKVISESKRLGRAPELSF